MGRNHLAHASGNATPQGVLEGAPPARAHAPAPPCQQCAALQAERDELKRERDELRAAIREMRNANLEYRLAAEERRQAQEALIEMYRRRERERDRLQRDRERERGRLQ
jgi:hypothetical protein